MNQGFQTLFLGYVRPRYHLGARMQQLFPVGNANLPNDPLEAGLLGEARGLNHHHLAEFDALSEALRIVDDRGREILVYQPAAD